MKEMKRTMLSETIRQLCFLQEKNNCGYRTLLVLRQTAVTEPSKYDHTHWSNIK